MRTSASGTEIDAPSRFHGDGMIVILQSSAKPMQLVIGDIPLDSEHTFICKNATCVIVMSVSVRQTRGLTSYPCPLVDGEQGIPACSDTGDSGATTRFVNMQTKVSTGSHTVRTFIHSYDGAAEVTGWQVNYSVYGLGVPPAPNP